MPTDTPPSREEHVTAIGWCIVGKAASLFAAKVRLRPLADEVARLRTSTVVRATSTTSLERRIARLEKLLRRSQQPPDLQVSDGTAASSDAGAIEESTEEWEG